MKKEKVYAFIDSQNLNLSVRNDIRSKKGKLIYKGWQLDFSKFFVYLKAKYKVNKAFLFIGYKKENNILYKHLKNAGYTLIFKPTLDSAGKTKGNVDAELVLHSMIEFNNYTKAIFVTGDGDFHCLIDYMISKKKLYKLIIPNQFSYSSLLRKFKTYITYVSWLKEKLQKK